MAIEDRNLVVEGVRLVGRYRGVEAICEVGKDADGRLTFTVEDKEYTSLSSAAGHVMLGQAVNGWKFWSIADSATTPHTGGNTGEKSAKAERKSKAAKNGAHAAKLIELGA